jgi:hypothetical protein
MIDAQQGGVVEAIRNGKKIRVKIPASAAFLRVPVGTPGAVDIDGDQVADALPVTGMLEVQLTPYTTPGDMVRGDRPTVTSTGGILETGGSFDLVAREAGGKNGWNVIIAKLDAVDFDTGKPIVASDNPMLFWLDERGPAAKDGFVWDQPVQPPADPKVCNNERTCIADKSCFGAPFCVDLLCKSVQSCRQEMCVGTALCPLTAKCSVANACKDDKECAASAECRVKCRGKCDTEECKDVPGVCAPWPIPAQPPAQGGTNYLFNGSPFGNIGPHQSANCDRLTSLSETRVTTLVRFASNYSEESGVFFLPTQVDSTVKLYTKIPGAPAGQEGYQSYANSMPVGVAGKLVVVAVKNGQYYYEEKPHTIGAGVGGVETVSVSPVQMSEAEFNMRINAL